MSKLQNQFFELYTNLENSPLGPQLGPQQVKKGPKIKSKVKVRIEGTIDNKSFSFEPQTPKKF